MPATLSRASYARMYGPTVGDKVRLADTDLIIEVEKDFTTYGEEVKFGGGKVIRDGMGQSQMARAEGADAGVVLDDLLELGDGGRLEEIIGVVGVVARPIGSRLGGFLLCLDEARKETACHKYS